MSPSKSRLLVPTEVCERIIDFVALRFRGGLPGNIGIMVWRTQVYATLHACSLTCNAWRHRSQFHLMRITNVQPSITGSRSFDEMCALFSKTPRLRDGVELLCVNGRELQISRFHLVPIKIPDVLPTISTLMLMGGLVYLPTAFYVCLRRFKHLVELNLLNLTILSADDLRRMVDGLHNLQTVSIVYPFWHAIDPDLPLRPNRLRPQSHIRLKVLEVEAKADWILDVRTIQFFDWLAASGAASELRQLGLAYCMLLDSRITAAVGRLIHSTQTSRKLQTLYLSFGPDADVSILYPTFQSLHRLSSLVLRCPSEKRSMLQLADFLSAILRRPEATMHPVLHLGFDQYPPYKPEPPAECWERLDSALQCAGLQVVIADRLKRLPPKDQPVVLGHRYQFERLQDENGAELGRLLPKTYEKGRLWHWSTERNRFERMPQPVQGESG